MAYSYNGVIQITIELLVSMEAASADEFQQTAVQEARMHGTVTGIGFDGSCREVKEDPCPLLPGEKIDFSRPSPYDVSEVRRKAGKRRRARL